METAHRDGTQVHHDGTQEWSTGMVCVRMACQDGTQAGWKGCGYTRRDRGDGMQGWYIRGWFTGIVHMDAGMVHRDGPQAMCTEIDSV